MIVKKTTTLCKEEICCGITNSLRKSNKIDKLAHIVIILEQPKFIDKLSHIITGNITFQQDDKEIVLMFPTIDISSLDVTNHHLNNSSLPSGEIKDILTLISCTERTDLVMMFSKEWSSSIDSTFEILCSLTKVNLSSNCKKFFIAHALSPSFDESLLEFHDSNETNKMVYHITVYSRNEDCLLSLLHHLHRNITGVVILPKMLHANYMLQQLGCISGINENLEKFNECLNREIKFVNNFLHEFQRVKNVVDDNVIKFRTDLADLEKHTDLLYVRICQLNEQ
ncbi:hypothetical protein NQ314_015832 [Rhamnusium bicolor]|uniref:Uncharacterized protein n=1 Tax=Rhamnusium bicolor TaxID=1586634 RepID=A0AAV8WYF5_9CUCU|nr:hypothetical protein NQ314_015832 [Rhamnusium bicolor]